MPDKSGIADYGRVLVLSDGRCLHVHPPISCAFDEVCAVHKPSEHDQREWPIDWQNGILVRSCGHGIWHPDPDALAYAVSQGAEWRAEHECDGCCDRRVEPASGTRPTKTVVIRNSAACSHCGEEIVSSHVHDFVTCSCGGVSVDGGHDYLRRAWNVAYADTSITVEVDMSNAEIVSHHQIGLL